PRGEPYLRQNRWARLGAADRLRRADGTGGDPAVPRQRHARARHSARAARAGGTALRGHAGRALAAPRADGGAGSGAAGRARAGGWPAAGLRGDAPLASAPVRDAGADGARRPTPRARPDSLRVPLRGVVGALHGRRGRRRPPPYWPPALVARLPEPHRQPARSLARARRRRDHPRPREGRRARGGPVADRLRRRPRRGALRPRHRGPRDRRAARPRVPSRGGRERSPRVRPDARRIGARGRVKLVVVGGGVTALAAAHRAVELARARGVDLDLRVVEARRRLGGTIVTERADGFLLEGGPDSFLSEKPWALALCRRLGIEAQLLRTDDRFRKVLIWFRGRLHPLPDGFQLLAPTRLASFAASSLFSWRGKARMALDLMLPRGGGALGGDDESLGAFVRRRLGAEALQRVAQPLVAGIYTADPDELSVAATMPRFVEAERHHRSLILGLRRGLVQAPGDAGLATSGTSSAIGGTSSALSGTS